MNESEVLTPLAAAVEQLDAAAVRKLIEQGLHAGLTPQRLLAEGLSAGMRSVGRKFNEGEMFMPEVLVACDVYFSGLAIVKPLIGDGGDQHFATMVLGNIHGDVHTVGKNVAMPVFEANGIRVIDLGEDQPDEAFVEAIRRHKPDVVGFGTYMTSTFMHTKETVAAIARAGAWAPTMPRMTPGTPSPAFRPCWLRDLPGAS
jgi:methanogenic corrinoid protein MtbC1